MAKKKKPQPTQFALPGTTSFKKGDRVRYHPGPGRYQRDILMSDPYYDIEGVFCVDTVQKKGVPMSEITLDIPKYKDIHIEEDSVPGHGNDGADE